MARALGTVDGLSMFLLAVALGAAFVVAIRAYPVVGLWTCLVLLGLVPPWVGASFGFFVTPLLAACLCVIVALWPGAGIRLRLYDALLLVVLGVIAVSFAMGIVTLERAVGALVGWGVAYLTGRVLGARIDARTIATSVAWVFVLVAALAVVEFVTRHNMFVDIRTGGGSYARWSGIRWRGGVPRAEGAWGSAIALGGALAMSVPFIWTSRLRPAVKALALVLVGFSAVVTFSRIGMVATILALVGCLTLFGDAVTPAFRRGVTFLLVAGAALVLPMTRDVFTAAGTEASGSADYRGDLLALVPAMRWVGHTAVVTTDAAGNTRYGRFGSIDSAPILAGLDYGILPLLILLGAAAGAMFAVLRAGRSAALLAVVVVLPGLTSVAFITQFTTMFWLVAGLAVAQVEAAARSRAAPRDRAEKDVPAGFLVGRDDSMAAAR